jgi:hypothetical protein
VTVSSWEKLNLAGNAWHSIRENVREKYVLKYCRYFVRD